MNLDQPNKNVQGMKQAIEIQQKDLALLYTTLVLAEATVRNDKQKYIEAMTVLVTYSTKEEMTKLRHLLEVVLKLDQPKTEEAL